MTKWQNITSRAAFEIHSNITAYAIKEFREETGMACLGESSVASLHFYFRGKIMIST
jgi:hypothetical protein